MSIPRSLWNTKAAIVVCRIIAEATYISDVGRVFHLERNAVEHVVYLLVFGVMKLSVHDLGW